MEIGLAVAEYEQRDELQKQGSAVEDEVRHPIRVTRRIGNRRRAAFRTSEPIRTLAKHCFLVWFMVPKSATEMVHSMADFGTTTLDHFQPDRAVWKWSSSFVCSHDSRALNVPLSVILI